jgi:hypothetical protein
MTHVADLWVVSWLSLLSGWSIRWGVILIPLAALLAMRPPRRASTRYLLCLTTLIAGILLPLTPRWGNAILPWQDWERQTAVGESHPIMPVGQEGRTSTPGPLEFDLDLRSRQRGPNLERTRRVREPMAPSSTRPAIGAWQLAALALTGVWAAIVLALLARLVFGWRVISRLRREASEAGWTSCRLLGECRSAIGLSRRVSLGVHPAVSSPVVLGGLRPLVLVPADWAEWPEPQRRACLLHELSHLSRYDDWAGFGQEILRAHFFFHPLVCWLLTRLDREREILCDEAAVLMGSDPVAYAQLLLDLARRPGRLSPASRSSGLGLLPFFDRRTVKVRIDRLLEEDMLSTLARPSKGQTLLLCGLVLVSGLTIGGLRVHAGSPDPAEPPKLAEAADTPEPSEKPAPKVRPTSPKDWPLPVELRGLVLDPDGKPVPDVTIVAGS